MYLSIEACGFINGEMFWYLIKDGGSEDIGKQNIFLRGGGGIWKKMSSKCFHQIQSRSKPRTEEILRYMNIKSPSKHSCTRWYKERKVFNNSPRKQHRGTIVAEENNKKENNISVSELIMRQLIK